MNLFRSEEHARNWSGFKTGSEGGLLSLGQYMEIFAAPYFQERGSGRYISSVPDLRGSFLAKLKEVTDDHPFWRLP